MIAVHGDGSQFAYYGPRIKFCGWAYKVDNYFGILCQFQKIAKK